MTCINHDVALCHRMSFLMCAVGFILPMLFEENKRSYHLMLQEFTNGKGHEAFFDAFDDVVDQLPVSGPFRGGVTTTSRLPGRLYLSCIVGLCLLQCCGIFMGCGLFNVRWH